MSHQLLKQGPCFGLFIVLALTVVAQAGDLATSRDEYSRLKGISRAQDTLIQAETDRLNHLSKEIRTLKASPRRSPSIFRDYRLQSLLQEAQTLSTRIQQMVDERRKADDVLAKSRENLVMSVELAIENQRQIVRGKRTSQDERKEAYRVLDSLSLEKMRIVLERASEPLPYQAATLLGNGDSPDDWQERLNAIRDFERRLSREISVMRTELDDARRQMFVRNEVAHLIEEEEFFGERGFVRGGAQRNTRPDATLLAKTTSNNPPTSASDPKVSAPASVPPETTETGSSATGDGGVTSSSLDSPGVSSGNPRIQPDTAGLTTNVRDGAAEIHARDPLAQLASGLGLSLEEPREARSAGDSLQGYVRWVERRISTTQRILKLLHERAAQLEHRLDP